MREKISKEDLKFVMTMANPIACAEVLFSDIDNLSAFEKDKSVNIRLYQYHMLSWDSLFVPDSKKSDVENFEIQNGMAECYDFGGRLIGKSAMHVIIDSINGTFNNVYKWAVISSLDATHIISIFNKIIYAFDNHPILRFFGMKAKQHPYFTLNFKTGCLLQSVNNNIFSRNPGAGWFGVHADRHWMEESSFLTNEISSKLLMAKSEKGMINIWSGMAMFNRLSPIGKIFFDLKNKNKIVNTPTLCNPTWNKEKEEAAIREFNGKESAGYTTQILGKVIENAENTFDMMRVRECYNDDKEVKHFELNRDNFYRMEDLIVIERLKNAEKCYVTADVGEGAAPTEIIIMFLVDKKWKYVYNITATKLSPNEQCKLFDFIVERCQADLVGNDCGSGVGKTIYEYLSKKYQGHTMWVAFNEKLKIDIYERDENGELVVDKNGNYINKEEYATDWSVQLLKKMLYSKELEIPTNYKFDYEFSNIITQKANLRVTYKSKVANHLWQAFQVFAIMNWQTEFIVTKPVDNKPSLGVGSFN